MTSETTYVACKRLRWGDGYIEPGERVPVEDGRNYELLVRLEHIAIAPKEGK